MKKYLFALSLILAFSLDSTAFADTAIYIAPSLNSQALQNSINGVTSAIDAQTQTIKNMQTQQQNALIQQRLDALDQSCVNQVFAFINSKDTALKEYKRRVSDGTANVNAATSYDDQRAWQNYVNTAYTLEQGQIVLYENAVIKACTGYVAAQPVAAATSPATKTTSGYALPSGGGSGSVGGSGSGKTECKRPVLGKITSFDVMTPEDCYTAWQKAVAAAVGPAVAATPQNSPQPVAYVAPEQKQTAQATTSVSVPMTKQDVKPITFGMKVWSWFRGLLHL